MNEKVKENVEDIISQINEAKLAGKKFLKVKTFQCAFKKTKNGNTIPCDVFLKQGMYEGGEGENELKKLGYSISYEKTTKQATVKTKANVQTVIVKPLNTTNMIIKWK